MVRKSMVRTIVLLAAATLFIFTPSLSHGSEGEILLKMLLKKGIITQSEYDEVMAEFREAGGIEQRLSKVEKETAEIAEKQEQSVEEQRVIAQHVDKHIIHAEESAPAILDRISIGGGITMTGQGTAGNDDNDPPGEDVIDGSLSADLEMSAAIGEYGEAFLHVEAGAGDGITDEVDNFWGVNADAGDSESHLELTEAWYEHRFLDDRLTFTIGKVDLSNYLDGNEVANDETTQFLADGFVNNAAIEFPDNTAGARLTVSPHELLDFTVAWQDGDGDFEDIFEGPFLMGEADIKPAFSERRGNYRIYLWMNGQDHRELKNEEHDREDGWGMGTSIDQQVTDAVTLFARLGYQDDKVYEFDIAWSAGFALSGSLWGRTDDVLALAYGEALLSDDYEDILEAEGVSSGTERHFEAYYRLTFNEYLAVTPDLQIISNAAGDDDFSTVTVGAVRGQLTF